MGAWDVVETEEDVNYPWHYGLPIHMISKQNSGEIQSLLLFGVNSSWKGLIGLRPMSLISNGPLFWWIKTKQDHFTAVFLTLFWKSEIVSIKVTLGFKQYVPNWKHNLFLLRKLFVVLIKVLELSGSDGIGCLITADNCNHFCLMPCLW